MLFRSYYDTTGKVLRFYPIYASRQHHTFRIGEPVVFDPAGDPHEEKQRIAALLHDRMLALARQGGRHETGTEPTTTVLPLPENTDSPSES